MSRVASPPEVSEGPPLRSEGGRPSAAALLRSREEIPPSALRAAGFADLEAVAQAVAGQLRLPRLQLDEVELSLELAARVPRALAERHLIVPTSLAGQALTLASCDPSRFELFDFLRSELRLELVVVVATAAEIRRALERLYAPADEALVRGGRRHEPSAEDLQHATAALDRFIARGVDLTASDIHLEAGERELAVRYRIDGVLRPMETLPMEAHPALVSRIKVLAQLDLTEHQVPQDGRIKIKLGAREVDLRVSILPTYWGEKVCCRILDNSKAAQPLEALGFEDQMLASFRKIIRVPYGLVLVTGPTGSGKSTTLYGALNSVRSAELNIVTVEDPVEYQLPGINQVPVNPKRGLTFAGALRATLRQDPNVILVGEIRDRETGVIAAEAALTGHLVLAAMHTNDAVGAITRLTEMGVEPYLIAPSLVGVVAQRLIRKICPDCRELYTPEKTETAALGLPPLPIGTQFARGRGCETCQRSGYLGRQAIRELLEIDEPLRQLIGKEARAVELRRSASDRGFKSMRHQGLQRLFEGLTSAPEVIRATRS